MPRQPDPMSGAQVSARAKRMRGAWTEQVLLNLAGALVQATRWRAWEASGGEPGPQDNPGSWPRLPETPGERVELGITRLDMATPEGWEAARELLERAQQENTRTREQLQAEIAADLAETLEHSPQLSADFYSRHSRRAGEMLLQRTLPVTTLSGAYQSLWRKPEHPLGLPPADHPISTALAGHEEATALEQVAWEAARELYRALGNPHPDEHGRRGLERPEELRRWGERLGLVQLDGTAVVGVLGDESVHRANTGLPWSKAQATMLSPRLQEQPDGRPPGQLHRSERKPVTPAGGGFEALVSVAEHSSALEADPLAWAHVQKAQQLLETHGPEMARLSLYLSMHVCGRPDPAAPFLITGEALLEDFNLTSTSGGQGRVAALERSKRLKHQAELARALDRVAVQTKDYIGKDAEGRRMFRRFTGRLWQVESLELGTESQLTLGADLAQASEEVVTTLRLLVRPGSWVRLYPAEALGPDAPKSLGTWYGHVATAVLKLSHQRNQLAACLGLYLSSALVERKVWLTGGTCELKVSEMLERATLARDLEQALADRRYAERLRSSFVAALDILHHLVGFRFSFCPDTYKSWAIPESLLGDREPHIGPAPHGALEQLMGGLITVGWPLPVLEATTSSKAAAKSEALMAEVRNPKPLPRALAPAPTRSKPNGALLKEARLAAGLNQRDFAGLLGMGKSTYNRMETCQRPLPRAELDRYLETLTEHVRRERWERARRGGS